MPSGKGFPGLSASSTPKSPSRARKSRIVEEDSGEEFGMQGEDGDALDTTPGVIPAYHCVTPFDKQPSKAKYAKKPRKSPSEPLVESEGEQQSPGKRHEGPKEKGQGQRQDDEDDEDEDEGSEHIASDEQYEEDAEVDVVEEDSPVSDPPSEIESEDSPSPPLVKSPFPKTAKMTSKPKPKAISELTSPPKQKSSPSSSKAGNKPSGLKVTLKLGKSRLGAVSASASSKIAPSTPSDSLQEGATPDRDIAPKKRRPRLVGESEEEFDELEMDEQSVHSTSRMTARQAAMASGLGTDLLELPTKQSKRKKALDVEELAARRAETAKKRKELTNQKLEDDKTETINRLLKRQSASTRRKKAHEESQSNTNRGSLQPDSGLAPGSRLRSEDVRSTGVPCFRWISRSSVPVVVTKGIEAVPPKEIDREVTTPPSEEGPTMTFSFSIPSEFLPLPPYSPPSGMVAN